MKPSREVFKYSGQPEDKEVIAKEEEEVRLEMAKNQNDPEFQKIILDIKWNWLKERFTEILRHTDIDPASLNLVPVSMIQTDETIDGSGEYESSDNIISINPVKLRKRAERWQLPLELLTLELLIHEQIHAISKTICKGIHEYGTAELFTQRGYSHLHGNSENKELNILLYGLLDEGVTEKLTRQILLEYLEAHPNMVDAESIVKLKKLYEDDKWAKIYDLEVSLIEAMIAVLSKETGVSKDTIWNAILRGKMEGEDLSQSDFQELAKQFLSEEFLQELRDKDPDTSEFESISLIEKLSLENVDPVLFERIRARIKAAEDYERGRQAGIYP